MNRAGIYELISFSDIVLKLMLAPLMLLRLSSLTTNYISAV